MSHHDDTDGADADAELPAALAAWLDQRAASANRLPTSHPAPSANRDDDADRVEEASIAFRALPEWLAATLAQLVADPDRWILILEAGDGEAARYVQYLLYEDGSLVAETVSNNFLPPAHAWRADDHAALAALGWAPPDADRACPPDPDADRACSPDANPNPNWSYVDPGPGADWLHAARLGHQTLLHLFGLAPSDPVGVTLFRSPLRGDTPAHPAT